MSGPEIAHRVAEQGKRHAARWRRYDWAAACDGPLPRLPNRAGIVARLSRLDGAEAAWREVRERVLAERFRFLGTDWPSEHAGSRWHLDPTTGRQWPADRYCFSIDARHAPDLGDPKFVLELNRLQHLQPLAALAALGDTEAGRHCAGEIESWIDANPPFNGINWLSGIELALRTIGLIVILTLVGEDAFSPDQKRKLLGAFAAHGYWLRRYPSHFSSANNHLIAEATALYLLGSLMPGYRDARNWAEYGRRVLTEEAVRQIHPDGVGGEQSPTYTAFTLEMLLLAGRVAADLGEPFPPEYVDRIAKAGEALRWILDAAGSHPRIGDDDEGRVFYSQTEPEPYVASVLGCIAAFCGRPDLAPPVRVPHLREAFLGMCKGPSTGPLGVRQFPDGGYTVARSGRMESPVLLVFDHGPLGYGATAAHGHADALSVWLHVGGQPVLADAGTYLYYGGGEWRRFMRSTPAHNTLSIEGRSSSAMAGDFNWSRKASAHVVTADLDPERWFVAAEHDGYERAFGVRHCRKVAGTGNDEFTIADLLTGADGISHSVEIGFLIHPALDIAPSGNGWAVRRDGRNLLRIDGEGPLAARIVEGGTEPIQAWCSERFGHKIPARRLVFAGPLAVGAVQTTRIQVLAAAEAENRPALAAEALP